MTTMTIQRAPTFWARIFIAGAKQDAERICRQFCFEVGQCVTVQDALYVYTGGQEAGVVVGFINYARFPKASEQIVADAENLGRRLMEGMFQHSFSIETPAETIWFSRRPA